MLPNRLLAAMAACSLPLLLQSPASTQSIGPAADPDLEQLAQRVDKAHFTDPTAQRARGFVAHLRIGGFAKDARQRGELELQVNFLEWNKPATGRPWPLIRYQQIDSARTVEYGRDRRDYWALLDGRVRSLKTRELEVDLESCRRNLRLARQMTRFLEPGVVLRTLMDPGPVLEETLRMGRAPAIACTTVTGKLAGFPLRQIAGNEAPVSARIFIDQAGRLLAIEVAPLTEEAPEDPQAPSVGNGEFLFFADYRELGGRLVPMKITHFSVPAAGVRKQQMQVHITTLELDPSQVELDVADFDRPQG